MWVLKSNRPSLPGASPPSGFTLIEVIAAVSIISIVLLAVYRLHAQTISMNSTVRFYTIAPLLAQMRIAAIDTDLEGRESGNGDFGEQFPGYAWEITIEDTESEYLGETAATLKKIDLVVSFARDGSTYRVRTYRLMPDKG